MVARHTDDHLQTRPVTGGLELGRQTVPAVLPVSHQPPDEAAVDGPAGRARAPPGQGRDVRGDAVEGGQGGHQTGVAGRTAGQPGCRGEIVLRADVDLPVGGDPGGALGPGRLPHGLEAGGQAARGGALLHPVQPDPVRGELLAGHHARLGVHLLAAQGDAHRVVDGQDQSLVSLSPCKGSRISVKKSKVRRELQYLMTAMLTGAVEVMMGEPAAMLAPSL